MDTLLEITDTAMRKVQGFRAQAPDPDRQAMWIEVTGVNGGEWAYTLSLKPLDAAGPDDAVQHADGLPLVVPAADADKLRGATIDWIEDLMNGGLTVRNPNVPSPAIGGQAPADLSGPVAQRVARVLDEQINPAIASHGGGAELVAVEDGTAYVRLGGGCVGCGMAGVTLGDGIETSIAEAVPEVTRVVDVTDHASGTNPYYS